MSIEADGGTELVILKKFWRDLPHMKELVSRERIPIGINN